MKTAKPAENQADVSHEITVHEAARQLGRRGGTATRDRHGIEFYRKIGAKGGKRQKELYRELLAEFGRLGGRPRRPNLENTTGEEPLEKKEDAVGLGGSPPA